MLSLLLAFFLLFNPPAALPAANAFPASDLLPEKKAPNQPIFSSPTFPDSTTYISSDSSLIKNCPKQAIFIKQIIFEGNKKTREKVLRAELGFTEGAILDSAALAEETEASRIRLFNLQLFHWVKSEISCDNGQAHF